MNRQLIAVLAFIILDSHVANATPAGMGRESEEVVFAGSADYPAPGLSRAGETLALNYMTAAEMQQKVRSLTGFLHRDFNKYADVLGRWDPRSGVRTADRPSLISVLFIKKISTAVAAAVLRRESFLDPDERSVFRQVDLFRAPTDAELESTVSSLYQSWLNVPIDPESLTDIVSIYRAHEGADGHLSAYQWLVEYMLQHGGIYYY